MDDTCLDTQASNTKANTSIISQSRGQDPLENKKW